MRVQLNNLQKRIIIDEVKLKRIAKKILKSEGKNDAELSIVLTDNRKICLLNKKFRKIDKPTDVLAFSMREGEDSNINPALLGDVVISLETAARCAKQLKITREEEIYRYLTHGVLHLLGYDHRHKLEREVMKEREESILKALR